MNRDKHIWEGWTVGDFIDDIEPFFDQCGPFMDSTVSNFGFIKTNHTIKNIYRKYIITFLRNQDYEYILFR